MDDKRSSNQVAQKVKTDPYAHLLGIKLEKIEEGYAQVSLKVKKEFCNFLGYVHGGLIFSLADHAFAAASNSRGKTSVALQMNINYVRAPSPGDTLVAEAREEHCGSKIGLYRIEVRNALRQLVAEAQGIVYRKG